MPLHHLDHVSPGSRFEPDADAWNAFIDAAKFARARKTAAGGGAIADLLDPAVRCLVKNTNSSVTAYDAFSVLAYGAALVDPTIDAPTRLLAAKRPVFEGATPSSSSAPFVVTVEPIQGQSIGRAVVSGLVPVQVDVTNVCHNRARPASGVTDNLVSCYVEGGVPIVWPQSFSTTGVQWCMILLDFGGTTPSTCTTTTTTTTTAGCTGSCSWSYNSGSKIWTNTADTCSTGCGCFYPDYCPTCTGTQTTTTSCFLGVTGHGSQPQCNTTTTTTAPPGCTGSCTWKSYPVLGWVNTTPSACLPSCPCATPSGAPSGDCTTTASTDCYSAVPPPPPPCTGNCLWVYGTDVGWIRKSYGCTGGAGSCYCAAPTTTPACATEAYTPCTGNPETGTTTTLAPASCTGRCYWCWDGGAWTFDKTECFSCLCPPPSYAGSVAGEVGITSCVSATTTTTTTTTTSTTTTTTPPPCCNGGTSCQGQCQYVCLDLGGSNYQWVVDSRYPPTCETCSPACGCPDPNYFGSACWSGVVGSGTTLFCICGGTLGTTTTTTSTTTSTTTTTSTSTTTTAAPSGTVYLWGGCGGGLSPDTCCHHEPMGCSGGVVGGPYASCAACIGANPMGSTCFDCSP